MIVIAYVPILHEGYRKFFEKYKGSTLMLLGDEVKEKFVPLVKDIRALPVELIKKSIEPWNLFKEIKVIGLNDLKKLPKEEIVVPDEDIMSELQKEYFPNIKVKKDSIFLRWDKHKSMEKQAVNVDQKISRNDFDKKIILETRKEGAKSADFWIGNGAIIIKNKKIIARGHNDHVPSEQTPYVDGDPRSDFHKGVNVEITTALHAEAKLVAEAAKKGTSLKGLSMYTSKFPCPPCAKMIAFSGIKKLYYADGYGMLDGEKILKSQGVEIIFVEDGGEEVGTNSHLVEYKKK